MRKLISLTTLLIVAGAGIAVAATTTTVTGTLTPNTPKKGSEVVVTVPSFPPAGSAPTALKIDMQSGFSTATAKKAFGIYRPGWADSTTALCSTQNLSAEACATASTAKASLIGQGKADVVVSSVGFNGTIPINITMFLGVPPAGGCPGSVEINFQVAQSSPVLGGTSDATNGTICRHNGGLEIKFDSLPDLTSTFPLPAGTTFTVHDLTLSAGASNRITTKTTKLLKNKVNKTVTTTSRAYLVNNPATCPASRAWNKGTFSVTFSSGTVTDGISFACK